MAAMEMLCRSLGIDPADLSKEELLLLEAEIFSRICEELKETFRQEQKDYIRLMKLPKEKENAMLDGMFVRLVIKDILASDEYNLAGLAQYTDTHEDVIHEVVDGRNNNPSATLLRRSIELHRSVRRELYQSIMKKIARKYLA